MHQNCFQTIDELQKRQADEGQNDEHEEPSPLSKLKIEANPILPVGKGHDDSRFGNPRLTIILDTTKRKQKPHIRYASVLPRLDDSSFTQAIENNTAYKTKQDTDYCQFTDTVIGCRLIFKKLNNQDFRHFTKVGREYFCSIFLDPSTISSLGQNQPIDFYRTLSKQFGCAGYSAGNDDLNFDSSFESGNLFAVFRRSQRCYDLFMMNDINTKGSTQWFYFEVRNRFKGKYRFRILNFYKDKSLYESGMRILALSAEGYRRSGIEWRRVGQSIEYCELPDKSDFNTLAFTYEFEHPEDRVYFSYSYPYTFSDLQHYLRQVEETQNKYILKEEIGKSLLGQPINLLTINEHQSRQIIYVVARQHAGQSPSSYVMEGFMNFLLSNKAEAQLLRRSFCFKIIPMVNVDGVTLGNYRTNLAGYDLNRKWDFPDRKQHPEIVAIKQKILEDRKNVRLFLDLHAHSRKMNSFFYGGQSDGGTLHLFPFICSRLNKYINKDDCSYGIDPGKKSTARAVVQNELGVKKSYTFEVSFFGPSVTQDKKTVYYHFDRKMMRQLGQSIVLGLFYSQIAIKNKQYEQNLMNIMGTTTGLISVNSISLDIKTKSPAKQQKIQNQINEVKESARYPKRIRELTDQLYEKWLKEKSRLKSNQLTEVGSSGSDSCPEERLLNFDEIEQFELYKAEQSKQIQKNREAAKKQMNSTSRKNRHFGQYSLIQKASSNLSRYNDEQQTSSQGHIFTRLSNLKDKVRSIRSTEKSVKGAPTKNTVNMSYEIDKLETQLQINEGQKLRIMPTIESQTTKHGETRYGETKFSDMPAESNTNFKYNMLELKKTMRFMLNIDSREKNQLQNCFQMMSRHEKQGNDSNRFYEPLSTVNKRSNSLIKGRKLTNKMSDVYFKKV